MLAHSEYQIALWLLLIAGSRVSECRVVTGPEGLCAFGHLEPARSDLRVGSTLHVRVNGSTCSSRWRSTAPEVASVDSTGFVRALHAGSAEIQLEPVDGSSPPASMQLEVLP